MKLTDLQKKTLQMFALYCESQNSKKVSLVFAISDCGLDSPDRYFYDEDGGSTIDTYPKILNLLSELAKEIKDEAIDSMEECENYGELKFLIDCDEKDLTIQVYENVQTSTDDGSSDEIPKDEHFRGLIEYMKKHGYTIGHVYFNGGGDSGYIENKISCNNRTFNNLIAGVEDFLYRKLGSYYGGWEINEGSQGKFEIYLDNKTIQMHHESNFYDNVDGGQIFYLEF